MADCSLDEYIVRRGITVPTKPGLPSSTPPVKSLMSVKPGFQSKQPLLTNPVPNKPVGPVQTRSQFDARQKLSKQNVMVVPPPGTQEVHPLVIQDARAKLTQKAAIGTQAIGDARQRILIKKHNQQLQENRQQEQQLRDGQVLFEEYGTLEEQEQLVEEEDILYVQHQAPQLSNQTAPQHPQINNQYQLQNTRNIVQNQQKPQNQQFRAIGFPGSLKKVSTVSAQPLQKSITQRLQRFGSKQPLLQQPISHSVNAQAPLQSAAQQALRFMQHRQQQHQPTSDTGNSYQSNVSGLCVRQQTNQQMVMPVNNTDMRIQLNRNNARRTTVGINQQVSMLPAGDGFNPNAGPAYDWNGEGWNADDSAINGRGVVAFRGGNETKVSNGGACGYQTPQTIVRKPILPNPTPMGQSFFDVGHDGSNSQYLQRNASSSVSRNININNNWTASGMMRETGLKRSSYDMDQQPIQTLVTRQPPKVARRIPLATQMPQTNPLDCGQEPQMYNELAPWQPPVTQQYIVSPLQGVRVDISNLPPGVTRDDLIAIFGTCGALKRVTMKSTGYAEVVFVEEDVAHQAINEYNHRTLDGYEMILNLATTTAPSMATQYQRVEQGVDNNDYQGMARTNNQYGRGDMSGKDELKLDLLQGVLQSALFRGGTEPDPSASNTRPVKFMVTM